LSPALLKLLAGVGVGVGLTVGLGPLRGGVAAIAVVPLAVSLIARVGRRPERLTDCPGLPLALDLLAAVLRRGQPLAAALSLCAPIAGSWAAIELSRVASLLRLGADPETAWQRLNDHPVLGGVAAAGRRSAHSGIRLAAGLERLAADLRLQAGARGRTRAEKAGVWAMAPLGLCFLPAFVCIGVIPVIAGIAHDAFSGLTG
jgi:pilus assembly protein TadC